MHGGKAWSVFGDFYVLDLLLLLLIGYATLCTCLILVPYAFYMINDDGEDMKRPVLLSNVVGDAKRVPGSVLLSNPDALL